MGNIFDILFPILPLNGKWDTKGQSPGQPHNQQLSPWQRPPNRRKDPRPAAQGKAAEIV